MTRRPPHDRRLVLWLSLAQLITWGSVFYTFSLLVEPVERELGVSRAQSSLAFSLTFLAEGLCAYQVGRWIDRGHERVVMTGGSVLAGVCLASHSLITSLAGFYAVWALLGVAMAGTLYTPVFAVVTRRFPDDFRRAIITMTFLGGLASTVFIPLTAWLIASFGWRHALWCLAALQLLLCAPIHGVLFASDRLHRSAAVAKRHHRYRFGFTGCRFGAVSDVLYRIGMRPSACSGNQQARDQKTFHRMVC